MDMDEKATPVGRAAKAVSPQKLSESTPMEKIRQAPAPKKALQRSVMNAFKLPGLRKILQSLAFAKLIKLLRMIARFIGPRAIPVIALIIFGWIFRRVRKR
jgi:hypothetical protein